MNANFGLLPPLSVRVRDRKEKRMALAKRALEVMRRWIEENALGILKHGMD